MKTWLYQIEEKQTLSDCIQFMDPSVLLGTQGCFVVDVVGPLSTWPACSFLTKADDREPKTSYFSVQYRSPQKIVRGYLCVRVSMCKMDGWECKIRLEEKNLSLTCPRQMR